MISSGAAEKEQGSTRPGIKAVIFDCDGVLLESREANAAFYNEILRHFHRGPLTAEQLHYVHSHTVDESLTFLLRDPDLVLEAERFWRQLDYRPFIALLSLQPGVIECLESLCRRYRTAIATSRTHTMGQVLDKFRLERYFDLVITSLDVHHPKPHPESLQKIIGAFALLPRQACYIGDSRVDQQMAREAGIPFIAYGNKGLAADYHLSHFGELLPLLERLETSASGLNHSRYCRRAGS